MNAMVVVAGAVLVVAGRAPASTRRAHQRASALVEAAPADGGPVRAGAARLAGVGAALRSRLGPAGDGTEAEHAALLGAVARSLRAGYSLADALDQAVANGSGRALVELDRALRASRHGEALVVALDRWAAGTDPARAVAGAALALGAELGGARADALDAAAASLADRAALASEVRALTAQARASAAVLVLAPVVFAALAVVTGVGRLDAYASPVGLACLVTGAALDAAGAWWMASWTR